MALKPGTLFCFALILLIAFLACEGEAKNKAGKVVKNAAKAYAGHKAAKSSWKIFKIIGMIIFVGALVGGIAMCFILARRRAGGGEGFGLLREGP
ncbi:Hypothetical predicted protein [Cloeon dipterum]|uniref:Uncharacterized protein n=1 Tax=Cloeon dipterum TaxID=197152 RepID=A0A8S1CYT7_9INSE|nr:Hypothetical predicted protein [Cloeon dipterum]